MSDGQTADIYNSRKIMEKAVFLHEMLNIGST